MPDVTAVGVTSDDDDDDDDDDRIISDEAESMELGTGPERGTPGVGRVAVEVEPRTRVLGVGRSPMLDACTLVTTTAGTGVLVVGTVGLLRSSSSSLL